MATPEADVVMPSSGSAVHSRFHWIHYSTPSWKKERTVLKGIQKSLERNHLKKMATLPFFSYKFPPQSEIRRIPFELFLFVSFPPSSLSSFYHFASLSFPHAFFPFYSRVLSHPVLPARVPSRVPSRVLVPHVLLVPYPRVLSPFVRFLRAHVPSCALSPLFRAHVPSLCVLFPTQIQTKARAKKH